MLRAVKVISATAAAFFAALLSVAAYGESVHCKNPALKSCDGLLVTGYQGWFRCPQDGGKGKLYRLYEPKTCRVDMWPDMREYSKKYPTLFKDADGNPATMFSSLDESTSDLHFKWMKEYGIDAAFVQRFYSHTIQKGDWRDWLKVMENCMKASQKHRVGMIVMYDLSGMGKGKVADGLIADWKLIVDSLKLTSHDTYVFHNGKPLVCVWGIGLSDRPNFVKESDLCKFLDFLKDDPKYGGCAIMIGTGGGFREIKHDCAKSDYLHDFLKKYADIISPWNVGRYSFDPVAGNMKGLGKTLKQNVAADVLWCKSNGYSYMPTIYAGFSWHNKMKNSPKERFRKSSQLNKVPRLGGRFYWEMARGAIDGGANMLYISMFDEIDEATAIFKLCANPPKADGCPFVGLEGAPEDRYLFLSSQIKQMLKDGKSFNMPL